MSTVFLSYATKDYFFADLAEEKLAKGNIKLWRDSGGQLLAGTDWREGIESGISESLAVIVALSQHSAASSYVTYEWAYALGKGKRIIPMKIAECSVHPRLERLQHFDFSQPLAQPWDALIERIHRLELETKIVRPPTEDYINAAVAYLDRTKSSALEAFGSSGLL